MYGAVCAVDGKKILVPFKPDGMRPVYCEEHMDLIKFRSKGVPASGGAGRKGEVRPEVEEPRPVSLASLTRSSARQDQPRSGLAPAGPKREPHLTELRKVLEESLRQSPPAPPAPAPAAPRPESSRSESQPLAPGETIRLD
jgi:CxxC-x17-CxxC domain-containing protein